MAADVPLHSVTREQGVIGLRAALSVLDKWKGSSEQACHILSISQRTYASAKRQGPEWSVPLNPEQLQRISLVLNIHAVLRTVFANPENVYGFPSMANHNEFFNGNSPLEVMAKGDLRSLHETFEKIDALRFLHGDASSPVSQI